nr:uncharacterized protein C9orf57 homolog [Odocoileus virginianus texanus]
MCVSVYHTAAGVIGTGPSIRTYTPLTMNLEDQRPDSLVSVITNYYIRNFSCYPLEKLRPRNFPQHIDEEGRKDLMVVHVFPPIFFLARNLRMRTVFNGAFILFCLLGAVGGVICRQCNLSIPFHGCLLDFGTCRTKPGQYCIKEILIKGGIQWYSIKGCTESQDQCFQRILTSHQIYSTHCCHRPLCNF